jgi:predicted metal-dependent hydrolase
MTLSDLPEIQITRNPRSTRLRLRVDGQQIKVTAPVFCSNRQIQNFIQQSESWLFKTWQAQQEKNHSIDRTLPTHIKLFNREDPIQIVYQTQKQNFIFESLENRLIISDRNAVEYLKAFVIAYAKQHLPEFLKMISVQCQLPYQNCNIRQPKTRWGSCSAKHDIMLNSGIVLFDPEVVRYLCVHELAHTRHFDHSANFWSLVEKFDPTFQQHRKLLKTTPMPFWWTEF